jgi:hypothetical protein
MYAREKARLGGKMWIYNRPRRGNVPRAMPMEGTNCAAFSLELLCTTCRCCDSGSRWAFLGHRKSNLRLSSDFLTFKGNSDGPSRRDTEHGKRYEQRF